jgi:ABC-type multidrug transport system ATPase subunit
MEASVAIEVRSLSKKYGNKSAVNDVSFEVPAGGVTGFLGPNGAGKSTTMRVIVGLDRPSSGEALIDGHRYAELRLPLLDAKSARRSRTAVNHLRAVAAPHGMGQARVDEVIDLAGLASVARKRVGGFSLGMSQRLGIAVALLGDPGALILDEPVLVVASAERAGAGRLPCDRDRPGPHPRGHRGGCAHPGQVGSVAGARAARAEAAPNPRRWDVRRPR